MDRGGPTAEGGGEGIRGSRTRASLCSRALAYGRTRVLFLETAAGVGHI